MKGLASLVFVAFAAVNAGSSAQAYEVLAQKKEGLPITTFNVTFRVGSADDPKGFEGLANLTGRLLREGGVKSWSGKPARSRAALEEYLFPLAAEIEVSIGKEQTSFTVTAAASDAGAVFEALAQLIAAPALDEAEFDRIKSETLEALINQWPREDQEELGKFALEREIYGAAHPYAHVEEGTVEGLKAITLDHVKAFYASAFTQKRVIVGVAGVVTPKLSTDLNKAFKSLPVGEALRAPIPLALAAAGPELLLVKGPFSATGVHLGSALAINRAAGSDFDRLYLASLAFGKHRSFVGRLMREVREVRSLNYGAYAYVEDFPNGGTRLSEPTQAARSRQAFTVWGRPTTVENGCFLLRQLHREVGLLATQGLTEEEFKLSQSHLVGNAPLLATGIERRLGYAIDSRFYGISGDYLVRLQGSARHASLKAVNALLAKYLNPAAMKMVVVTPNPEKFKAEILKARCDVQYASEKGADVKMADEQIAVHAIGLSKDQVKIVEAESLFERQEH